MGNSWYTPVGSSKRGVPSPPALPTSPTNPAPIREPATVAQAQPPASVKAPEKGAMPNIPHNPASPNSPVLHGSIYVLGFVLPPISVALPRPNVIFGYDLLACLLLSLLFFFFAFYLFR